ncbi:MAG: tetratricopeptide repeat protein [Planctomycetes bacterium]|nr:tetratricopeptide repeat protein [Planctomycetota bacterium]
MTMTARISASSSAADAARLLEQAIKAGCQDRQVVFMLGLAYKKLGRNLEARQTLRKIAEPDSHTHFQLGLLAFAESEFEPAEREFSRAWELLPDCYPAGYNVLLCRLCRGQLDAAAETIARLLVLAQSPADRETLQALDALLCLTPGKAEAQVSGNGRLDREALLGALNAGQEQRLLQLLARLQFEVAFPLLRELARVRPGSHSSREAYLEVLLLEGRQLIDRGKWEETRDLLAPHARAATEPEAENVPPRPTHTALLNMLGCCACMLQDFDHAVAYFTAALNKVGNDAWLHQNLALSYEWLGKIDRAEAHWNHYVNLINPRTPAPALPRYLETLIFEAQVRLSDVYFKREKWSKALAYLQRAHQHRPDDADTLERLFHLYSQLKKPDEARRALRRLRDLRPNDPQFELYELDIKEIRSVDDIDRLLGEVRKAVARFPNDLRVEERAAALIGNANSYLGQQYERLAGQLNRVADQMRRLPAYQINWPAVRDVLRDLQDDLLYLRRTANKCLALVHQDAQRRKLKDLVARIDRKIELCHSMRN